MNNGLDYPVSAEDLSAYIDGELPMARRQAIKRMLLRDPEVRSQATDLVRVRTLVRLAYRAIMTE